MGTSHELHNTAGEIDPELSPELRERIHNCALQLKAQFAELQDRTLAVKVGRLFGTLLLPPQRRCGRPRSAPITAAIDLAKQGVPRAQIPWKVIPGFGKLSRREQSLAREQLRRAVYMRRKRENVTTTKRGL
jgi:hypothetical protein